MSNPYIAIIGKILNETADSLRLNHGGVGSTRFCPISLVKYDSLNGDAASLDHLFFKFVEEIKFVSVSSTSLFLKKKNEIEILIELVTSDQFLN